MPAPDQAQVSKRVKIGLAGCGSVSQRGLLPHLSQPDI